MLKRQYSEEEIKDPSCFSLICSCCGKQQHVWTYSENSEDREKLREFCEKSFKEKYASYYKNPAPPMLMTALTPVNFEI